MREWKAQEKEIKKAEAALTSGKDKDDGFTYRRLLAISGTRGLRLVGLPDKMVMTCAYTREYVSVFHQL